jgi:hypothetical protein
MKKKKAKKKAKKTKRKKTGKLAKIKKGLDGVDDLVDLLEECGFDSNERTYTPIAELRGHAEEINAMFVKLLGDQWWKLELPKKAEATA